jgi:hypothetical protein
MMNWELMDDHQHQIFTSKKKLAFGQYNDGNGPTLSSFRRKTNRTLYQNDNVLVIFPVETQRQHSHDDPQGKPQTLTTA